MACARVVMKSIEANATILTAYAGAPLKVAFTTGKAVAVMTACEIGSHLDPDLAWIEVDNMDKVDWPAVAAKAGEFVDFAAWQAWSAERFPEEDGES